MKTLNEYFFMRNGFQTFRLEPDKHSYLLVGKKDRGQRDHLLDRLEEASYSLEGYKSVVIGDFGRGKTHQSKNIEFEINRRKLKLHPIYVKCGEFKTKEPFSTFFKELVLSIKTEKINQLATDYQRGVNEGKFVPLQRVIDDEDVAQVFVKGLTAPNLEVVRSSMRWLGGEPKIDMTAVSSGLPVLNVSKQFGSVVKGLVQLFKEVDGLVPLFLIDEAERFQLITNTDAYWSWLAALRELTEIVGIALIFFIGSKSRDDIPAMFATDEVMTRIGVSNYVEFYNPGREDLADFLKELFQTLIKKGAVPEPLKPVLQEKIGDDIDGRVPPQLQSVLSDAGESLETYPFTQEAFQQFIETCATEGLANKPREVLIRIQKAASRAVRLEKPFITNAILEETTRDGI